MVTVMEMEQPIYGDVLFIVNFTMDFLTVYIVGKIMHMPMQLKRYCLSGAIGAVYGVASVFLNGSSVVGLLINLAVSLLMCYIAFEKRVFKSAALFYLTGCLLGGGMTALYHLLNKLFGVGSVTFAGGSETPPLRIPLGWMAAMAAVTGIAAVAGGQIFSRQKAERRVTVFIYSKGKSASFDCLCDSGNLLCDPIGGLPVLILKREKLCELVDRRMREILLGNYCLIDSSDSDVMKKIRFIPANGIGGRAMLIGFIPELIEIDGCPVDACAAVGGEGENFGGYDGIVPAVLCVTDTERVIKKC